MCHDVLQNRMTRRATTLLSHTSHKKRFTAMKRQLLTIKSAVNFALNSTTVKHIFAASQFCNFGTLKFHCILFWRFPSVLLVKTRHLMGKLNFRGYLISRFYPARENLMHAKKMCVLQYFHNFCLSSYFSRVTPGYAVSPLFY